MTEASPIPAWKISPEHETQVIRQALAACETWESRAQEAYGHAREVLLRAARELGLSTDSNGLKQRLEGRLLQAQIALGNEELENCPWP